VAGLLNGTERILGSQEGPGRVLSSVLLAANNASIICE
jgi:hypothetical protein